MDGAAPMDPSVAGLRAEMTSMLGRAEEELKRLRTEQARQYEQLRGENEQLRSANSRLAEEVAAREREGDDARLDVRATLEERNRTVAAIEKRLQALQAEHQRQSEGVLSTLGQRNEAVETLEAQLGAVQSQLLTVLQAQLQQRDDVRKLASAGAMQQAPLSIEDVQPPLQAPVPVAPSSKFVGEVAHLDFGDAADHSAALAAVLSHPRRSVAQEFAHNEGGLWRKEYEYVVQQPARQLRHLKDHWQAGSAPAPPGSTDAVVRDQGHDGWTLDDFCNRPLARSAGLTKPEVAVLRLYTGPAHAPLQFFLRNVGQRSGGGAGGGAGGGGGGGGILLLGSGDPNGGGGGGGGGIDASGSASGGGLTCGEVLSCTGRPYWAHFGGDKRSPAPFLFAADVAHRTATGEERCARCRRPRREHSRQALHDWSTSAALLCSALEKLAMWSPPVCAYRPLREELVAGGGGLLPPSFVPNTGEPQRGATTAAERGVLSCTADKQVALAYSGGKAGVGTLLEVSFDYGSRGAALQWVSQYPHEAELAYPPCTSLLPHGLRQWSERRRVIAVTATPSSLRVRTDAITTLDAEGTGGVHALAARVSQGVSGLGAGVGSSVASSVAKLSSWVGPSPPPPREPMPYDEDGGGASGSTAASLGGAGQSAGTPQAGSDLAARSAARRAASSVAAAATAMEAHNRQLEAILASDEDGSAQVGPPPSRQQQQQRGLFDRGAPTYVGASTTLRNGRSAVRADQPIALAAFGDPRHSQGARADRGPASAIAAATTSHSPSNEQRRAVLTINDALELLERSSPPKELSEAEKRVQQHLQAAESLLESAATAVPVWRPTPTQQAVAAQPAKSPPASHVRIEGNATSGASGSKPRRRRGNKSGKQKVV